MKKLNANVKSATSTSQKRRTHLYFQEKNLKNIPKLNRSKEVLVLYLYGNNIVKIENLNGFTNLVLLYLQKNHILVIENLQHLTKLKKLYIGHNNINVLEGLTGNNQLEELHIEKQNLPEGSCFCFDPRSVVIIRNTIQVLNISHNRISCLSVLSSLKNLKVIDASYNDLEDMREVCEAIQNWMQLEEANFIGNPIAKRHRYREDIIAKAKNLELLDGKCVSDITRTFIRRFEAERMLKGSKPSISITDEIKGLPNNYPQALQKAVSASLIRKHGSNLLDDLSTFDEKDAVYIAWKALPKRRPFLKSQEVKKQTTDFIKKTIFVNSLPQL